MPIDLRVLEANLWELCWFWGVPGLNPLALLTERTLFKTSLLGWFTVDESVNVSTEVVFPSFVELET